MSTHPGKTLDTVGGQVYVQPMTPKQELLELTIPEAPAIVAALLALGESWRSIAAQLNRDRRVSVSHESLRQWYGKDVAA